MKFEFADLTLDWDTRELLRAGSPVHLSPNALEMIGTLGPSPG